MQTRVRNFLMLVSHPFFWSALYLRFLPFTHAKILKDGKTVGHMVTWGKQGGVDSIHNKQFVMTKVVCW